MLASNVQCKQSEYSNEVVNSRCSSGDVSDRTEKSRRSLLLFVYSPLYEPWH